MPPAINPYRDWLGIAEAHTAPHHYRLLGLRLFEDDAAAITGAAARWTAMLTAFLSGPHGSEAERVLKEIDLARQCLLGPDSKRQYDDRLRHELRSEPAQPAHFSGPGGLLPPTTFPPTSSATTSASPSAPGIPELPAALSPSSFASQPPAAGSPPPMPPSAYPGTGSYPPPAYPTAPPPSSFGGPPAAVPRALPSVPYSPGGVYAQPAQYSQPGAYAQPAPYSQQGPYAQPGAYGQPSPYAPPGNGSPSYPQASYAPPMQTPPGPGMYSGGAMQPSGYAPAAVPMATPSAAIPQAVPMYQSAAGYAPQESTLPQAGGEFGAPATGMAAPSPLRRQRRSSSTVLYVGLPVAVVALAGIVLVVVSQSGNHAATSASQQIANTSASERDKDWGIRKGTPSSPSRPNPPQSSKPMEPAGAMPPIRSVPNDDTMKPPTQPTMPEVKPTPPVTPPTVTPTPPPKPTPMPPATGNVDTVGKALNAARLALSKQDIRGAKSQVEIARKADSEGMAAREIGRVDALTQYVDGFWNGVRESIKVLEVGGQVMLRDKVVGVVEVDAQKLILRVDGMNRTYPMSDLPIGIAFGLAENWFNKGDPASKIFLGSIQAVHPKGDRDKARELWQQAAQGGKGNEVAVILPELDVPTPVAAMLAEDDPKPGANGKLPPPGATALSKARTELKQMFEADLAEAKDNDARKALAEKMLARANETSDTAPLRFALLGEASQLSAAAGNYEQMAAALDRQEELFGVNALEAKGDALFEAAKTAGTPEANKALATYALGLSDEAVLLEKVDQAGKLVRIALGAARKANDPELLKACSARDKEVKELKKT